MKNEKLNHLLWKKFINKYKQVHPIKKKNMQI